MKNKTKPIRGCIDYMPFDTEKKQAVTNVILDSYLKDGFLQIRTPILENLDLLVKGDTSDNSKLMFKTIKRGEKLNLSNPNLKEDDIVEEGLRYDLTVPLARFFAENKQDLPFPFKSIQIGESFRAERPQKGRYRQFTQCDVDILGEDSILGEIEIITTVMNTYKKLGLRDLTVKINSRKIISDIVLKSGFEKEDEQDVCIIIDKLDKIGAKGCEKQLLSAGYKKGNINNLLSVISSTRGKDIKQLENKGYALDECKNISNIIKVVQNNIPEDYDIEFDVGIIRGQGYYTGTIFEVFQKNGDYKSAIGGGGRYDKMIKDIIGEEVPSIGFGLGLDVALLVMKEQGIEFPINTSRLALIYNDNFDLDKLMEYKSELSKTYNVSLVPEIKNFKELLRKLKLNNFNYFTKINDIKNIKKVD